MRILAIETSCDETAAAVVEDGVKILTNIVASSEKLQEKYGGVVPEVAARAQVEYIIPVLTEAAIGSDLEKPKGPTPPVTDIDAIAVTVGPGLIGSLLIGVETAKTLAFTWNKPIIPVNHVLAHMYANFVINKSSGSDLKVRQGLTLENFPAISLVVSGGHTELYLMESPKKLTWLGGTLDDAAGECFDKCARLLGFGNRGGLAIQEAAEKHKTSPNYSSSERSDSRSFIDKNSSRLEKTNITRSNNIMLPRPMIHDDSLNFSFSGLKTAVLREWKKTMSESDFEMPKGLTLSETMPQFNNETIYQFAYEIQEAITDVLVAKTLRAAQLYKAKSILLSGGVAANLRLREKFNLQPTTDNPQLFVPPVQLCTDNAVCIASYAFFRGKAVTWKKVEAKPDLSVELK